VIRIEPGFRHEARTRRTKQTLPAFDNIEVTAMIALLNSYIKTVRSGSSLRRVALNYGRILLRNIRTRGHDGFVFM